VTRYDLLYLALAPVAAPVLAWKSVTRGKYRESFPGMFGRHLEDEDPRVWKDGCVWLHAVSYGETVAAKAMLPMLRERFKPLPVLLTTVTETGQGLARTLVPEHADAARYYPADFSRVVRRFLDTYRPCVYIVMETEIWPNALMQTGDSGARIFMLNGRLAERSHANYRRFASLFRAPLARVTAFCMQTETDAERMRDICGSSDRVFVTGNCKFDLDIPPLSAEDRAALLAECGIAAGSPVVVVGSTHPGEEEIALAAFRQVRERVPTASMVLVPRHPERFAEVWGMLEASGLPSRRISDGAACGGQPPAVVLIDRMRMLVRLYGVADVAAVAGSFVDGIGGHNVLEAAAHGVPVIYGPHMHKQPDMTRILDPANGGTVAGASQLGSAIIALLTSPADAGEKGRLGREAVMRNRGSAARNMEIIERFL
jgi:3-deoxy-D-manno-octulosonic-acid transferase